MRMRAMGAHRRGQRPRAGIEPHALGIDLRQSSSGSPFSSATRSRSAEGKSSSPRIARSVIAATLGLRPDIVRQLVDAFAADDRGIHVGDEQFLAAVCGRNDVDVEQPFVAHGCAQRCRHRIRVAAEGNVEGLVRRQPVDVAGIR